MGCVTETLKAIGVAAAIAPTTQPNTPAPGRRRVASNRVPAGRKAARAPETGATKPSAAWLRAVPVDAPRVNAVRISALPCA